MKPLRLDKLVATQLGLSRSEAVSLIRRGQVTAGCAVCRTPAEKYDPEQTPVSVGGQPLVYREHLYLMLNKPSGILCVSRDPNAATVTDLLPACFRRRGIFPAGRLDKDTGGFVFLTDDGDFGHRLTAPKQGIYKIYRARLDGPVGQAEADAFAAGITLADGTVCRPAGLRILEPGEQPLVEIAICEGRFHQIKRMFGVCGRGVCFLKRMAIGDLWLDEQLEEGACRLLTEQERERILRPYSAHLRNYYEYLIK